MLILARVLDSAHFGPSLVMLISKDGIWADGQRIRMVSEEDSFMTNSQKTIKLSFNDYNDLEQFINRLVGAV